MSFSDLFKKRAPSETDIGQIGRLGEDLAAKYLKKKGYRIVGVRVHAGNSELDLIATKADTLVFAEVKTRTVKTDEDALTRPADAVNSSKITYLIRGANRFCRENADKYASFFKRFDIIEVYLEKKGARTVCKEIRHFENAIVNGAK